MTDPRFRAPIVRSGLKRARVPFERRPEPPATAMEIFARAAFWIALAAIMAAVLIPQFRTTLRPVFQAIDRVGR